MNQDVQITNLGCRKFLSSKGDCVAFAFDKKVGHWPDL